MSDTEPKAGSSDLVPTVLMTEKRLMEKTADLQNERKIKFQKGLMNETSFVKEVKVTLEKYIFVDDPKTQHEVLMTYLPKDESERQEMWFKIKMLSD